MDSCNEDSEISDGSDRFGWPHTFIGKTHNNTKRSSSVLFYRARTSDQALTESARPELYNLETFSNFTFKDRSSPGYIDNTNSVTSIYSSTLRSSTDSFLALTGIFSHIGKPRSDIQRSASYGGYVGSSRPPEVKGAPVTRTLLPARRISSAGTFVTATIELQRLLNINLTDSRHLRDRTVSTQSELAGHVPRHMFERKVHSAFPERGWPPPSSNVFILLTDGKGQTLFAVNMRSSNKKRRHRGENGDQDYSTEAETVEKVHSYLNNQIKKRTTETQKCASKNLQSSSSPLLVNVSTQVAMMRSFKKRSAIQKESCALCGDKLYPKPESSYVRKFSETLDRSSDKIILHYQTEKTTFDLHRECDLPLNDNGKNLDQIKNKDSSTQTSDSTYDACVDAPPGTVRNENFTVSSCNKLRSNDIIFTPELKNTRQQLQKISSISQSTSTSSLSENVSKTNSSKVYRELENIVEDKTISPIANTTKNGEENNRSNEASKININIESAKECYNVSIQFSERVHDKLIKRTIMKKSNCEQIHESLPGYLPKTNNNHKEKKPEISFKNGSNKTKGLDHPSYVSVEVADGKAEVVNGCKGFNPRIKIASSNSSQSTSGSSKAGGCERPRQDEAAAGEVAVAERHYRGDECLLPDPLVRDREICRLLGVDRRYASKCRPSWPSMLTRERNNFSRNMRIMSSSSPGRIETLKTKEIGMNNKVPLKSSRETYTTPASEMAAEEAKCGPSTSGSTEPSDTTPYSSTECKPRICTHEPIHITQSEYQMIKRSLHQKPKIKTDHSHIKKNRVFARKNSFIFLKPPAVTVHYMEAKFDNVEIPILEKQRKFHCKSCCNIKANTALYHLDVDTQTFAAPGDRPCSLCRLDRFKKRIVVCNTDCTVLNVLKPRRKRGRHSRQSMESRRLPNKRNAMSSVEVYKCPKGLRRPVTCSMFNLGEGLQIGTSIDGKCTPSVFTLFKGKKEVKRCTPNLGTSTFTVTLPEGMPDRELSNVNTRISEKNKSFVKKLWNFVIKRKSKDASCQIADERPVWASVAQDETLNSSVDSYYINSSLEGIEISSSIYDTSVSQFSQHTVVPTATKKKVKSVTKKIQRYWNKA